MAKVLIPTPLRQFTAKQDAVSVPGATVGEVLRSLTSQYPDLRKQIFTDEGKLRSFVNVYLNDEDISYLSKDATAAQAGLAGSAAAGHAAVGDGQAAHADGCPAADVEDPAGVVATDGQLVGAQAFDVQTLGDGQLAAGQRDGLTGEAGIEGNGIAALGGGDGVAQRSRAAVGVTHDRQGAGQVAAFQRFQPGPEPRLEGAVVAAIVAQAAR